MAAVIVSPNEIESGIQKQITDFLPISDTDQSQKMALGKGFAQLKDTGEWVLPLKCSRDGLITLVTRKCPQCGRYLNENGSNPRIRIISYEDEFPNRLELKRYVCKFCGEIILDYSQFVAKHKNYPPEYLRQARELHAEGQTAGDITLIILTTHQQTIPPNTIKSWINEMKDATSTVMNTKEFPASGFYSHDEIHTRVADEKKFVQITVDTEWNLIAATQVIDQLKSEDTTAHFEVLTNDRGLPAKGIATDDASVYSGAFSQPPLQGVPHQLDIGHVKQTVRKKIYAAAGLKEHWKRPLPSKFQLILKLLYAILNSQTEFDFIFNVGRAMAIIEPMENPKVAKILQSLTDMEELLIAHVRTPDLAKTTNATESVNAETELYAPFKYDLKSKEGMLFMANLRGLFHNSRQFPMIFARLERMQQAIVSLKENFGYKGGVKVEYLRFFRLKNRILRYYEIIRTFWETYFSKGSFDLFQQYWSGHH